MSTLSIDEARKIVLEAQGLTKSSAESAGKGASLKVIERLGYVQIDTISVVERAHHHVFWTRNNEYQPEDLGRLMAEKSVFEYWSHAASILPMKDFRFSLPRKKLYASGKKHWGSDLGGQKKIRNKILSTIKEEGPKASKDFEEEVRGKKSGWWDWKPQKQVLEQLFMEGQLMVRQRQGFQKIYDLPSRVLPSNLDMSFPSEKEMAKYLVEIALKAHGIIRVEEISYLRSKQRALVEMVTQEMLKSGELIEVKVESIHKPYFARPRFTKDLDSLQIRSGFQFLSPFDNQIIQRRRLKELFNFDYSIECYLPEGKRKFGYFSLPIMESGQFVGRMDAKAHRLNKELEMKSVHFESSKWKLSEFKILAQRDLESFAKFNGCNKIFWPAKRTSGFSAKGHQHRVVNSTP